MQKNKFQGWKKNLDFKTWFLQNENNVKLKIHFCAEKMKCRVGREM